MHPIWSRQGPPRRFVSSYEVPRGLCVPLGTGRNEIDPDERAGEVNLGQLGPHHIAGQPDAPEHLALRAFAVDPLDVFECQAEAPARPSGPKNIPHEAATSKPTRGMMPTRAFGSRAR
jgi:hypothetical protein